MTYPELASQICLFGQAGEAICNPVADHLVALLMTLVCGILIGGVASVFIVPQQQLGELDSAISTWVDSLVGGSK